ncbi:TrmH family RNA methyltransferase [Patescibacteria group bacterium]
MNKLNAKELRKSNPTEKEISSIKRNPIYLVLDRIIDTYNIGSIFRLADAIAAEKIYLCGMMEHPPSSRIHKAAVGTQSWVPWEKTKSTISTVKKLKKEGVYVVAIEQDSSSISYHKLKPKFPIALVCGNETEGLTKEVLKESNIVVELPMMGINKSFNVWGSTAVVSYKILEQMIK